MIEHVGTPLAIMGAGLSIIGTLVNNLKHQHHPAMLIWGLSNPCLFLWALGYTFGWWDGSLSISALLTMYFIFTITGWYGLSIKVTQDKK